MAIDVWRGSRNRLLRRVRFWRRLFRQVETVRWRDSLVLRVSAVIDTVLFLLMPSRWAPRTIAGALLRDPEEDLVLAVRGRTDDVYIALPHRESDVEQAILDAIHPGAVMVDGGAHIGFYTLRAARRVGTTGTVIAIEADPATFRQLTSNVERNNLTNVVLVNAALGASSGQRVKLVDPGYRSGTTRTVLLPADVPLNRRDEVVETRALGELCRAHHRIGLVKLDIEGAELEALRGAAMTLPHVDALVVETNEQQTEIANLLAESGFEITQLQFTKHLAARRPRGAGQATEGMRPE